jgi:hypothetical protein
VAAKFHAPFVTGTAPRTFQDNATDFAAAPLGAAGLWMLGNLRAWGWNLWHQREMPWPSWWRLAGPVTWTLVLLLDERGQRNGGALPQYRHPGNVATWFVSQLAAAQGSYFSWVDVADILLSGAVATAVVVLMIQASRSRSHRMPLKLHLPIVAAALGVLAMATCSAFMVPNGHYTRPVSLHVRAVDGSVVAIAYKSGVANAQAYRLVVRLYYRPNRGQHWQRIRVARNKSCPAPGQRAKVVLSAPSRPGEWRVVLQLRLKAAGRPWVRFFRARHWYVRPVSSWP